MTLALESDFRPVRVSSRLWVVGAFAAYAALLAAGWWGLDALLPDQVGLRLAGHQFHLSHIHDRILSNGLLVLLVLPSALWLECVVVGWEQSSMRALLRPSKSVRTDLAIFLADQLHLTGLVGKIMMLGLSVISGVAIKNWLAARTGIALDGGAMPFALQVAVYFVAYSFFDYWAHRLGHHKLFWPLHRYHHAAEEFCVLNAARIHPAGFAGIFFINIPMPLLGATPEAMIWVNVMTVALGFFIHSRIEWHMGWVGRYVIQSPLHHRLHHKLDMSLPTGFFGMLPVWDHLFGGWSERRDVVAIGVDTPYRQGLWLIPDLLRDYADFFKGLVGKRSLSPSER